MRTVETIVGIITLTIAVAAVGYLCDRLHAREQAASEARR